MNKKNDGSSPADALHEKSSMLTAGSGDVSVDEFDTFGLLTVESEVGIIVVRERQIVSCSPTFARMFSVEQCELSGASPLDFFHPDDHDSVTHLLSSSPESEHDSRRILVRRLSHGNDHQWVELLKLEARYGDQRSLIVTMRDISATERSGFCSPEHLRFEKLLADIATRFVSATIEEIDRLVEDSLRELVDFLGNDRSTLVEFDDDERVVTVTHSYSVPGVEPFPMGVLAVDQLPWFIGQFRSGKTVFLRDLPDDLPPEAEKEKQYCLKDGLKSNITVPLHTNGTAVGAITFAFMANRCEWPLEIVSRLQLVGEIFTFARQRVEAERTLLDALSENQKLRRQLQRENTLLREQVAQQYNHEQVIGQSDAIKKVLTDAERVAVTDAPVLLLGETGTGKGLLAQTVHDISRRQGRPMITVNCASLPATLIESELFGREAGAYTGAASAQEGRFKLADRSTLFLDEIGDLPLELQAKFLRVLQDGCFERLGSPNTIKVDVRIIAATNRDLKNAVQAGKFREDLYHRLNVFPISIPPLRERQEDIPPLVWSFVERHGRKMGKTIRTIPTETMASLQRYPWSGNVRELSNILERALILSDSDTLRVELPAIESTPETARQTLSENEHARILEVLEATGWRIRGKKGAAEILGLKPTTLESRMARLGIKRP